MNYCCMHHCGYISIMEYAGDRKKDKNRQNMVLFTLWTKHTAMINLEAHMI